MHWHQASAKELTPSAGGWPRRLLPQRDEEARGGVAGVGWLVPPPDRVASKTSRGVEVPPASVTTTYGYDNANQLTGESRPGYSAGYSYDGNGNRTSRP